MTASRATDSDSENTDEPFGLIPKTGRPTEGGLELDAYMKRRITR